MFPCKNRVMRVTYTPPPGFTRLQKSPQEEQVTDSSPPGFTRLQKPPQEVQVTYTPPLGFDRLQQPPSPNSDEGAEPTTPPPLLGEIHLKSVSPSGISCPSCKGSPPLVGVFKTKSHFCFRCCLVPCCPFLACCRPKWKFQVRCPHCDKTCLTFDSRANYTLLTDDE